MKPSTDPLSQPTLATKDHRSSHVQDRILQPKVLSDFAQLRTFIFFQAGNSNKQINNKFLWLFLNSQILLKSLLTLCYNCQDLNFPPRKVGQLWREIQILNHIFAVSSLQLNSNFLSEKMGQLWRDI